MSDFVNNSSEWVKSIKGSFRPCIKSIGHDTLPIISIDLNISNKKKLSIAFLINLIDLNGLIKINDFMLFSFEAK